MVFVTEVASNTQTKKNNKYPRGINRSPDTAGWKAPLCAMSVFPRYYGTLKVALKVTELILSP
jgi:hypothetical protein